MTYPVFTNNTETTLISGITAGATTFQVTSPLIFNSDIEDGAGSTKGVHQLATLTDGTNIEIIKITNVNTGTGVLTVVRAQEGTTGYAFLAGDTISCRLTAAQLGGVWFGGDYTSSYAANFGTNAVDLVSIRTAAAQKASGTNSVAIGPYAGASGLHSIAIGDSALADTDNSVLVGADTAVTGDDNTVIGDFAYSLGASGVAVGNSAHATTYGTAIGRSANATAQYAVSVGYSSAFDDTTPTGVVAVGSNIWVDTGAVNGIAVGRYAITGAAAAVALGAYMENYITNTHVILGPSMVPKDDGETDEVSFFSGQESYIYSQEVSFKSVADNVVSITIPTGATFFIDEVGIMPTISDNVTGQPTIEFGVTGTTDAVLTATATTTDVVRKRERYDKDATNWVTDADNTGVTSLTMSVTVAATATTLTGRVYFKGILVEDE